MFKLKKILNKNNNAPEPEILRMEHSTTGQMENVYYLTCGELANFKDGDGDPTYYVAFRELSEYDEDRDVECFRITPDMIFEVKSTNSGTVGNKFSLAKDADNYGFAKVTCFDASSSEEGAGYVVSTDNYQSTGKVLVRFHCKQ